MTRGLRVATASIGLACSMLIGGCQSENPDPAPTAVLPTPAVPTTSSEPTPSTNPSSATEIQSAVDEAVDVYSEGRKAAEDLLAEQSQADVNQELSPYFAEGYLGYWEAEVAEFREKSWSTDGTIQLDIVGATAFERSEDSTRLSLLMCSDYSDVVTSAVNGERVDRGFTYSYDEIVMSESPTRSWRAVEVHSEALTTLQGSECEDSFT